MIVSNTTPLTCLLKIGRPDLLQLLYGRIAIPPEVAAELVSEPLDVLEQLRTKGGLWLSDTFLHQLRSSLGSAR